MRCEKNSIGILKTFHIYELLPTIVIFPFIFMEYTDCTADTMTCKAPTPTNSMMNGISSSRFSPVSRPSMKKRENTGDII